MSKEPMVIVGAGHCGGRAALELRDAGWDGPIHLIGEESAAPDERPPLSKGLLTGECSATQCIFLPNSDIERLGIHRHVTRATELDLESRNVLLASADRLSYGALLIATGGQVRRGCRLIFYSDASHRLVGVCGWGATSRMAKEFKLARLWVERGLVGSAESMRNPAMKLKALLQSSQQSPSEGSFVVSCGIQHSQC